VMEQSKAAHRKEHGESGDGQDSAEAHNS
jgi:hypothetical protein